MTIYIPPVDLQMLVAFTWEFQSSQDYFIAAVVMLKLQITTCMRFTINSTIPKQKRKDCCCKKTDKTISTNIKNIIVLNLFQGIQQQLQTRKVHHKQRDSEYRRTHKKAQSIVVSKKQRHSLTFQEFQVNYSSLQLRQTARNSSRNVFRRAFKLGVLKLACSKVAEKERKSVRKAHM